MGDFDDVTTIHYDEFVRETKSSNLVIVKGQSVYIPISVTRIHRLGKHEMDVEMWWANWVSSKVNW